MKGGLLLEKIKLFFGRAGAAFQISKKREKIGAREKIIFIKRLGILIESGIPIVSCLEMLARRADPAARRLINNLLVDVESGKSLAAAMARSSVFGKFAVNIVEVGETGGALAKNLDYLAEELRRRRELKRNIAAALVYPAFILGATIIISGLLAGYVFPKILPVFSSFKTDLPASTRALMAVSWAVRFFWVWIVAAVLGFAALAPFLFRRPRVRGFFDRGVLRLPLLGSMFQNYHLANFSRTLGLLLDGNVAIVKALEIAAETSGNSAYETAAKRIAAAVSRGESMASAMEKEGVFPPLCCQMAGAGENSGRLSSSLIYLSKICQDEMDDAAKNLTVKIEPALMVFIGVLVGFVAVAIITPVYGITQLLQK